MKGKYRDREKRAAERASEDNEMSSSEKIVQKVDQKTEQASKSENVHKPKVKSNKSRGKQRKKFFHWEERASDRPKVTEKPAMEDAKPGGLLGYRSQADKRVIKTISNTNSIALTSMIVCVITFIMTLMNTILISDLRKTGVNYADTDEWVECTLDNYIGYKVKKDWKVSTVDDAIMFQPQDSIAITAVSESVAAINKMHNTTLSYDVLKEYVLDDMQRLSEQDGFEIKNITSTEYTVLGTTGYRFTFIQEVNTEEASGSTHNDSLFFIYQDYLYTFTCSTVASYQIPEFDMVLKSIRIVPEDERPEAVIDNNTTINSDTVSGILDAAGVSSSTDSTASNTEPKDSGTEDVSSPTDSADSSSAQ